MNPFSPPLPEDVGEALAHLESSLRQQIFDDKTGLQNALALKNGWLQLIARAPAHLLFVEVDGMKRLNNEFTHEGADLFLEALGEILQSVSNPRVRAFHVSGDEFVLVTSGLVSTKVENLAERILRCVQKKPVFVAGRQGRFTVSVGIAPVENQQDAFAAVYTLADLAVQEAKRQRGNRYVWFDPAQKALPPSVEHRQECEHCHTHFSVVVSKSEYHGRDQFFCPGCGNSVSKPIADITDDYAPR